MTIKFSSLVPNNSGVYEWRGGHSGLSGDCRLLPEICSDSMRSTFVFCLARRSTVKDQA